MASAGSITMSMREVDRFKTIQAVVDGNLRAATAALRLSLTKRQVNRLVARYRCEGAFGLISRQRSQPGHRQLAPGLAELAVKIIRDRYADFGPTLACEKLRERHDVALSKETVRKLMTEAGLWIPRQQRPSRIHQPRSRRRCVGELIQIDGSDHHWFEHRAPPCTLLVYVDDATSGLMWLHFTHAESTFSYFEATRAYLEHYGKPMAFYSDKYSVFRVNRKDAGDDACTHFGRALYELNIEGICANSSQAKGRVERANLTLQDRLVKELRLRDISTMAAANAYVPAFMADYNQRFAKPPYSDFDAHRPIRDDEDLDLVFTVRHKRKLTKVLTLQYERRMYFLSDSPATRRLIGQYLDVYEYPDGRIEIRVDGVALPDEIYDRFSTLSQAAIVENKRLESVLEIIQEVQQQRDDRRSFQAPSRTHRGVARPASQAVSGKKPQRQLSEADLANAIHRHAQKPKPASFS